MKKTEVLIGVALRKLRLENDLTLEEVGNKIGKTKKSIQLYELGEVTISVSVLKQLTEDVYGIKIGTFLNSVFNGSKE